jgi:hypothetical protein
MPEKSELKEEELEQYCTVVMPEKSELKEEELTTFK